MFPKKKKKKGQSDYMKMLSTEPIKGLSSKEVPVKKSGGVKKLKSIFAR